MMMPSRFYTVTMAELYEKQGYLRKAAQIYQHLVGLAPEREDLRLALDNIERKIEKRPAPTHKELGLLLKEWGALLKKQKELKRK